jgi:hypothetical protein
MRIMAQRNFTFWYARQSYLSPNQEYLVNTLEWCVRIMYDLLDKPGSEQPFQVAAQQAYQLLQLSFLHQAYLLASRYEVSRLLQN